MIIATAAVNAIAARGDLEIRAMRVISRATGADTATAYPPMMIIAIRRVNWISDQKP
ncbi:hypothetical protein GCM10027073_06380 [Streptomyces chlorus]